MSMQATGDKFWKGSSHHNPWVRDLLWRMAVNRECKMLRLPHNETDPMGLPTHMQPTAKYDPKYKEMYHCVECSDEGMASITKRGAQSAGRLPAAGAGSNGQNGAGRAGGGGGGGMEGLGGAGAPEMMGRGGRSRSIDEKSAKKLAAYRDIMKTLMSTVEKSEARRREEAALRRQRKMAGAGMSLHKSASMGQFQSPALRYQLSAADRRMQFAAGGDGIQVQNTRAVGPSPAMFGIMSRQRRLRPMTVDSRTRTPNIAQVSLPCVQHVGGEQS